MGNFNKQLFDRFITLFTFLMCAIYGRTQEGNGIFYLKNYERVDANSMLEEGSIYLIGSVANDGIMYFLSSEMEGKKTNKLKAKQLSRDEQGMLVPMEDCLWKVQSVGEKQVCLQAVGNGLILARKNDDNTDLLLLEDISDKSSWYYTQQNNGAWNLYATNQQLRQLTVDQSTNGGYSYANYSTYYIKDRPLVFYKSVKGNNGENVMPIQGQTVCLASPDCTLVCAADGSAMQSEEGILTDGSMARMDGLRVWNVEFVDNSTFALKNDKGYLSYYLKESSDKCEWTIDNGWLCTAEEEPRYMMFKDMEWTLVKERPESKTGARINTVKSEPTQHVTKQGVCYLEGGWTASQLSELSLEKISCLDLTAISLPLNARAFSQLSPTSNMLIFVREEENVVAQSVWKWVVACGEEVNTLCDKQVEITDKERFYSDRNIRVKENQIIYQRNGLLEGKWQTFSLPFDADVNEGQLYQLTEKRIGELLFKKVNQIVGDEGYIGMADGGGKVVLTSKDGMITPFRTASSMLRGITEIKVIEATDESIFMLHPTEQCFKRAGIGSKLSPFRAYLMDSQVDKMIKVRVR